jgi:3-phosphoshikimate 1-carboxyvinyltransferase
MEQLCLSPINKVSGTVNVPGSKSLSNRALLLAALASGETHLTNLLDSEDIHHMLNALTKLNVSYRLSDCKTQCWVTGNAGVFNVPQSVTLFLGNAGTAMRPLCAALACSHGEFELTGEPRMEERPIGALVDSLRQAGADINYLKSEGYPPLLIKGRTLRGGDITVDGSVSSQFLTALLMSAPLFEQDTSIIISGDLVSKPYIDITLHIMERFGIAVENKNYQQFVIKGQQQYQTPGHFMVEGDASSASYFLAAGAIKGGTVKVTGIGKNSVQGDIRFAEVLQQMGAKINWQNDFVEVTGAPLKAIDLDMNHIPDAAMTIATTALFATGTTSIRNIYNWRVKETDRLAAMSCELRKVGATVEEGEDYITITPPKKLLHAEIDTYNDHRVAMCFSLVALSDTAVVINDPSCTAKTFPDYFQRFATICH